MSILIHCPACKKKISSAASACPKCGQPIDEQTRVECVKRAKAAKIGCLVIVVVALVLGMIADRCGKKEVSVQDKTPSPSAPMGVGTAVKPDPTLKLTLDDFISRFNKAARETTISITLSRPKIQPGSVNDVAQAVPAKYLSFIISMPKGEKLLNGITLLAQPKREVESARVILAMLCTIAAVDPGLPPKERGQVLRDLGLFKDNLNLRDYKAHTERGGIKYFVSASELIGFMFAAEPAHLHP